MVTSFGPVPLPAKILTVGLFSSTSTVVLSGDRGQVGGRVGFVMTHEGADGVWSPPGSAGVADSAGAAAVRAARRPYSVTVSRIGSFGVTASAVPADGRAWPADTPQWTASAAALWCSNSCAQLIGRRGTTGPELYRFRAEVAIVPVV